MLHPQSTARPVDGRCQYCGNANPADAFVHSYDPDGTAHRLYCTDEAGCTARQEAEAAWAAQRYELTPKGYAAADALAPIIRVTPEPGQYVAESTSTAGVHYALTVPADGRATCTCRGYEYRGICKHSRQLERIVAGRAMLKGAA